MRAIAIFLLVFSYANAFEPIAIDSIIYQQMLLLKSKMDINPIIWQDTKEGYTRNRTVRLCDLVLDRIGTVEAELLVEQNYPLLDSLMKDVKSGKEYVIEEPIKKSYQFNYFYSSSSKP